MVEIVFPQKLSEPVVLGMGFFDCVHMGHRKLLETVENEAIRQNVKSAVITFSNNPYKIFNYESKLIYTYEERSELFKETGIDFCIPFKFDAYFKERSKEDFLNGIFSHLNVKSIVCGYDYLFGAGGAGDTDFLKEKAALKGVEVKIIEPVLCEGERVSSTLIKKCLEEGDIKKANLLLTKPYFMNGEVVRGRGEGRKNASPTINLSFSKEKMLIRHGVYATLTTIDGVKKRSVTNVGAKPTYGEPSVTVETLIDNENRELYGKKVKIEFMKYLREIKKFDSPTELAAQIRRDLQEKY